MAGAAPSDAELRDGLERALAELGAPAPVAISRRESEYRTSFPLERLDVSLADGTELRLAFKRLDWHGLEPETRLAKPEFLHDPQREPAVYASILAPASLGAPRYHGAVLDPDAERHWLFVEWVEGRELYQVGEPRLWQAAARWLGEMHLRLAADLPRHARVARLIDYDEAYYRRWIERAREFAAGDERRTSAVRRIAERYDAVVEGLLQMPKTVVHGEFYAANVLLADDGVAPRVCPVDWELAAAGPGPIDLATLVSGGWEEHERDALVAAYRDAVGPGSFTSRQLDLARLHLAVQWLGWAPSEWVPPEGQRHDWLDEAVTLAERLCL